MISSLALDFLFKSSIKLDSQNRSEYTKYMVKDSQRKNRNANLNLNYKRNFPEEE